ILFASHSARNLLNDPPVLTGFAGRIVGFVNLDDAAFAVAGDTFVFTPRGTGQHNVGVARAFRHDEVDTNVEVETFKRAPHLVGIRQAHHHVVANGKQSTNLAFAHLLKHLNYGDARLR